MLTFQERLESVLIKSRGTKLEIDVTALALLQLGSEGRFAQAIEMFESLRPTKIDAGLAESVSYYYGKVGNYEQMKFWLEKCLALNHQTANVLCGLGVAHEGLGNTERARIYYFEAIATDRKQPAAYLYLARCLHTLGVLEGALRTVETGLAEMAESTSLWRYKGWLLANNGDLEGAALAYASSVSCDEGDYESWFALSLALLDLGRKEEADLTISRIPTPILNELIALQKAKADAANK